jgi:hypothetical protein
MLLFTSFRCLHVVLYVSISKQFSVYQYLLLKQLSSVYKVIKKACTATCNKICCQLKSRLKFSYYVSSITFQAKWLSVVSCLFDYFVVKKFKD